MFFTFFWGECIKFLLLTSETLTSTRHLYSTCIPGLPALGYSIPTPRKDFSVPWSTEFSKVFFYKFDAITRNGSSVVVYLA